MPFGAPTIGVFVSIFEEMARGIVEDYAPCNAWNDIAIDHAKQIHECTVAQDQPVVLIPERRRVAVPLGGFLQADTAGLRLGNVCIGRDRTAIFQGSLTNPNPSPVRQLVFDRVGAGIAAARQSPLDPAFRIGDDILTGDFFRVQLAQQKVAKRDSGKIIENIERAKNLLEVLVVVCEPVGAIINRDANSQGVEGVDYPAGGVV